MRMPSVLALACVLGIANGLVAQDAEKTEGTHTAKAETFRIEVSLKGTLQPVKVVEVAVEPEQFKTLKIAELAAQGAKVAKGDVILRLENEDLEKALRQSRFAVELGELGLTQTELELTTLEKTIPLDLKLAERTHEVAIEALRNFEQTDKANQIESAKRSVQNSEFSLEYATEELEQLRKMYAADDLTEETEEIILKRAERTVDNAKFSLELSRIRNERRLEKEIPRAEISLKEAATRSDLQLRKTLAVTPLAVEKKRIELRKARYDHRQACEKLAGLERDAERLVVRAAGDGIVYHGNWENGAWNLPATLKKQLKVGGTLPPDQVVLTLFKPMPVVIETTIGEKDVLHVATGATGTAKPTAMPTLRLPVKVEAVSSLPVEPGKFAIRLAVNLDEKSKALGPGMTAGVTLVAYEKADAITVPSGAVFDDGGEQIVYVVVDGKPQRRAVEVGRQHGGKAEILSGLKAGETIRTSKP